MSSCAKSVTFSSTIISCFLMQYLKNSPESELSLRLYCLKEGRGGGGLGRWGTTDTGKAVTTNHYLLCTTYSLLNPAGGRRCVSHKNSVKWPGSSRVLIAQWIEHSSGVRCQIFSSSHARVTLFSHHLVFFFFVIYLRHRKHVLCFYRVIQTREEVWENEKCCGNTSRRQVFPQLFRVLPNFHECLYNS